MVAAWGARRVYRGNVFVLSWYIKQTVDSANIVVVTELKNNKYKQILISCTYNDYLEAGNGDIPQKWLKAFQKMN